MKEGGNIGRILIVEFAERDGTAFDIYPDRRKVYRYTVFWER